MRTTKQRMAILNIVNNSFTHPTAMDIYWECRKIMPNISLGTVYRNLSNLEDDNQIKKISFDDRLERFDHINKHSHYFCTCCRKIIDLHETYVKDFSKIQGNVVNDCEVIFKGKCKDCVKKEGI